MSKLLINESPLQVLPTLAIRLGLNEAIFLQQLHWLTKDKRMGPDGHQWIRRTYPEWKKQTFPFWSTRTIERAANGLTKLGLVIIEQRDKSNRNRDNFYAIHRENYAKWESEGETNVGIEHDKLAVSEHDKVAGSEDDKLSSSLKDQISLDHKEDHTGASAPGVRDNEIPRQPDSDDEHDAKAVRYSIAEMENPSSEVLAAIKETLKDQFPSVPFEKFYKKWWRSRFAMGGIGRKRRGSKSTLREYIVNIEGYFETVDEGGASVGFSNNSAGKDEYRGPIASKPNPLKENCQDCFGTGQVLRTVPGTGRQGSVVCKHDGSTPREAVR